MKEAFSLRTMHKKIVMLSKLAGIILIFSYILSAGLPVSEDLAFLIWLFFILLLIFNSRPHAEVDPDSYWTIDRNTSFNSRPHAEVDINISHILCKISILFLIFFTKTTLNKAQKYEYYFIFAKINC